jgi:glutamyl-tRNA reductase
VKILLIGLSHKTAPLEVRERLAFTPATLRSALTHFDATHSQAHLEDVREGIILSTCNRLEVYTIVRDPEVATAAILSFLSRSCDLAQDKFSNHLYTYQDEEAVQHLLRVASGLDSMVLGEPQILGQVTEAYQAALAQGAAGTVLSALFRAAIHTGKRARTETAISVNSVSVSSVAAKLAQRLLGELSERQALLIGAGEMAAIAVRALLKRGVSKIVVANRTYEKSVELARVWGGKAINFQQLPAALAAAAIVITSTSAPHPILDKEILLPVIATRGQRPLFIIDIAVPTWSISTACRVKPINMPASARRRSHESKTLSPKRSPSLWIGFPLWKPPPPLPPCGRWPINCAKQSWQEPSTVSTSMNVSRK